MNRLTACVAAIAAVIGTPAFAADMVAKSAPVAPVPAVPSWTGFYIGIDAGGAWGSPDQRWVFTRTLLPAPSFIRIQSTSGAVTRWAQLAGFSRRLQLAS
jgi:opacity protein-like surface antigen